MIMDLADDPDWAAFMNPDDPMSAPPNNPQGGDEVAQVMAEAHQKIAQIQQAKDQQRQQASAPEAQTAAIQQQMQQTLQGIVQAFSMMAQQQAQAAQQMAASMERSNAMLLQVAQTLTAPKRVVRDADGVVQGVETMATH